MKIVAAVVGVVFLFVLPIPGTTTIRLAALFALAALAIMLVRREPSPPLPLKLVFIAWTGVALTSLLYAVDWQYSLGEIKGEIVYAFAAYAAFYYFGWHLRRWNLWLWTILASLLVLSVSNVVIWYAKGVAVAPQYFYNGVGAYTTYLVTVLPFVILLFFRVPARGLKRAAICLAPLLFLVPAYFTYNRSIWVSLAVTAVVLFPLMALKVRNRVQKVAVVVGLSLLIGAITVVLYESLERRLTMRADIGPVIDATIASDPRPKLWQFVAEEIADHPWSGVGFGRGSFDQAYPQWKKQSSLLFHAHNVFLNAGAQMGLPGIAVMIFLFAAVAREYWRLYQSNQRLIQWIGACGLAMVIGVLTKNMTDEFFRRDLALMFWSLVGASLGYSHRLRHQLAAATPFGISSPGRTHDGASLKFLIIRRDNIGDLVCTTPLIAALRARFVRAKIYALVNTYNAAVLDGNPDIDAAYSYTKTKHDGARLWALIQRIGLLVRLRREHFDYVILAGSGSKHSLNLARALKPKHIIGYEVPGRSRVIDIIVPAPAAGTQEHEVESTYRLLEPLGITGTPPALRLLPDPAEVALSEQKLEGARAERGKMLIAIQISSRKPVNRWPAEKFVELVRKLRRAYDASFLLLWAPGSRSNPRHPGDDEIAADIVRSLDGVPVIAYAQGTLRQLIADLSLCDCVITSDGGAMHIAAALGKPIVCFFGDAASVHWKPWNSVHVLLQPPSGRVSDIDVDQALGAFERLIALDGRMPVSRSGVRSAATANRFQSESGNF